MYMNRTTVKLALLFGFFCLAAVPLQAVTLTFTSITNNIAVDAAIGEAQLTVEVTDEGSKVLFTFINAGPLASSITDVYFDDGSLLELASIDNSDPGVSFSQPATPGELPSANTASPPFETTMDFSADSDSPMLQQNGVNPGESLGIRFNLVGGQTFADVLADLADGTLRVGIHVQGYDRVEGFEEEGSESFVTVNGVPNGPVNGVPEPATIFLLGMGLLGVGGVALTNKRNLGR